MSTARAAAESIESLEPRLVWRYFAGMAAVPRPSKREQQIRAHMRSLAGTLGLAAREDRVGNVLIEVPATAGRERAPTIILQGHLDMVCEKNADVSHDFEREGIRLRVDANAAGEQIVRAEGTTLGADNGVGVALALAAATDPAAVHGPLEILCTVDEEAGMTGAKNLDPSFVRGRRMLNLDSEEDDALYIGCAGGADTTVAWSLPLQTVGPGNSALRVGVSGLRGGHSGCDIHLNRGSAIALLVQVLLKPDLPQLRIAAISGGSKRNAIPREAHAIVILPSDAAAELAAIAGAVQEQARADGEAGCRITVEPATTAAALAEPDSRRILDALAALPHGVQAVVAEMPGFVQTSNGATTVASRVDGQTIHVEIGCLSRGSHRHDLDTTLRRVAAVGRLAGARIQRGNEYPGWAPNPASPTLAVCRRAYERVLGHAPRIASIHAGLECGIIGERIHDMDMVSLGPNIRGAHSPDEIVEVASVARVYKLLLALLADLSADDPAGTPRGGAS
ncbi:MAG: beta-Ala-His dipeptidase [Phycisphaerales bacterium]|nr:beta-Ala-His dipeptidase [Phycisphaerales bacterium]